MSKCSCDLNSSVPDWIVDYPKTLEIFQELGIDYSCGGKSLEYVCVQQELNSAAVLQKLLQRIEADQATDPEHADRLN